ncbi:hypothetical protein HYR69_11630, partial [Candidatus Sumerlaeota bacterium]|nr:hypothetical protein [Candidatus Sumerlaeota bacterium]
SYVNPSAVYFSLDTDCFLTVGGTPNTLVHDEDILYWNGASIASIAWAGAANGLPVNADGRCLLDLDALDVISVSPLEFSCSFDADAYLTVNSVPSTLVHDEDVVHFLTGSGFTALDFVGSAHGIPASANLNVFNRRTASQWEISFDSAGQITGGFVSGGLPLAYDDGDLVEWNTGSNLWSAAPFFTAASYGIPAYVDLDAAETNPNDLNTPTPTPSPTPSVSPTPSASPTVSPSPTPSPTPFNNAAAIGSSIPPQMLTGQLLNVTLTMRNNGNTTWTVTDGYDLHVLSDPCGVLPGASIAFGPADAVPPFTNWDFLTTVVAPGTPGSCTIQVRMRQNGIDFGATLSRTINVVTPVNAAIDWDAYE